MGEDPYVYSNRDGHTYSQTYSAPLEELKQDNMVPYGHQNAGGYSHDRTLSNGETKSYDVSGINGFGRERQLHHMPSLSTTCTTDSFQSVESGDVSTAFDVTDLQDFSPQQPTFSWCDTSNTLFNWQMQ